MVQRGVVRLLRRERTHRLFTERGLVMVEEFTAGGIVLAVSELVHHGRVESEADALEKKRIEF